MLENLDAKKLHAVFQALTTARKRLDERDWIQGQLAVDERGNEVPVPCGVGLCSVGFVRLALHEHHDPRGDLSSHCCSALLGSLRELGYEHYTVTGWNDFSGRTKEQVVAVFEHAIARVKKLLEERACVSEETSA